MSGRYSRKNNDGVRAKRRCDDDDDDDDEREYGDAMRRCGSRLGSAIRPGSARGYEHADARGIGDEAPLVGVPDSRVCSFLIRVKSVCPYVRRGRWRRSWVLHESVYPYDHHPVCDPPPKRLTAALGDAIHRDDPSPAGIRDEGAERTKPTRVVHAIRRNRRPY